MKNDNYQIQNNSDDTLSTDLDASSSSTSLSSSLVCEKPSFPRANNHFNIKIPMFTKSIRNALKADSLRNDQRLNVIEVVSDHTCTML